MRDFWHVLMVRALIRAKLVAFLGQVIWSNFFKVLLGFTTYKEFIHHLLLTVHK